MENSGKKMTPAFSKNRDKIKQIEQKLQSLGEGRTNSAHEERVAQTLARCALVEKKLTEALKNS